MTLASWGASPWCSSPCVTSAAGAGVSCATGSGDSELTAASLAATSGKRKEGCLMAKKQKRKVVVEDNGGVADVTQCPDDVEVEIIDHDNDSG